MGESYSFEIRERAADLYVTEGYTFEQVARVTGVSVSQLKSWSAEEGWQDQKRDYRKGLSDIKRTTVKLQQTLLKKALETMDPQLVYAAARLMSAVKGRSAQAGIATGDGRATGLPAEGETGAEKLQRVKDLYGLS